MQKVDTEVIRAESLRNAQSYSYIAITDTKFSQGYSSMFIYIESPNTKETQKAQHQRPQIISTDNPYQKNRARDPNPKTPTPKPP